MEDVEDNRPVTKGDLRRELLRVDDLARELAAVESRLTGRLTKEIAAQESRLMLGLAGEMARQANAIIEQIGANARVVDEKYQDLPAAVEVYGELDEHRRDLVAHDRPPAPKARRRPKTPGRRR